MVSQTFAACQACQIVTGEGGDMNCMFPGSDDDLADTEEIKAYLGVLMGINKELDLYDYRSTNELFHYFPVALHFPRKRFLELKCFLRFQWQWHCPFLRRAIYGRGRLVSQARCLQHTAGKRKSDHYRQFFFFPECWQHQTDWRMFNIWFYLLHWSHDQYFSNENENGFVS